MKVGDTLVWTLPDQPRHRTVVAPAEDWYGICWIRGWDGSPDNWAEFTSGLEQVRPVRTWRYVMYTANNRVVIETGDTTELGAELLAELPDEPSVGSVVESGTGVCYQHTTATYGHGRIWQELDQDGNPVARHPATPSAFDWRTLLYVADEPLTVVRLGEEA